MSFHTPRVGIRSFLLVLPLVFLSTLLFASPGKAAPSGDPELVAEALNIPWEMAVAPDQSVFVTERHGTIRLITAEGELSPTPLLTGDGISPSVSKFLGLVLHPEFRKNQLAYLYVTREDDPDGEGPGQGTGGIWLIELKDGSFEVREKLFDGVPTDHIHDGGRLVFSPDKRFLFVSVGDMHQPQTPQDLQSLNGKILRFQLNPDASLGAPTDNPFFSEGGNARYVWSYGHRHPQGLVFDAAGRLWETEHGPTGEPYSASLYPGGATKFGRDEVNLIQKGGNYGWPLVSGPMALEGTVPPKIFAPDDDSWAPGDIALGRDGSLYVPSLKGRRLMQFNVKQGSVLDFSLHFERQIARLRSAVPYRAGLLVAQDNWLVVDENGNLGLAGPDDRSNIYYVPLENRTKGGSDAADIPPAKIRSSLRQLGTSMTRKIRSLNRRGLTAGRLVKVTGSSLGEGKVKAEIRLRGAKGRVLARQTRTVHSGVISFNLRLNRTARKQLRRSPQRRLVIKLDQVAHEGNFTVRQGLRIRKASR